MSGRQALDPRPMDQSTNWGGVYIVSLAADGVEVPACEVVGVIFITAQNGQISATPHRKVGAPLRFVSVEQEPNDKAPPFMRKFDKSPSP